jgi:hypothetical protein
MWLGLTWHKITIGVWQTRVIGGGAWMGETKIQRIRWRRVEGSMAEIEADLEFASLDLPIGRATDVIG